MSGASRCLLVARCLSCRAQLSGARPQLLQHSHEPLANPVDLREALAGLLYLAAAVLRGQTVPRVKHVLQQAFGFPHLGPQRELGLDDVA